MPIPNIVDICLYYKCSCLTYYNSFHASSIVADEGDNDDDKYAQQNDENDDGYKHSHVRRCNDNMYTVHINVAFCSLSLTL